MGSKSQISTASTPGRKEFDLLRLPKRGAGGVVMGRASDADIEEFHGVAKATTGRLADPAVIKRIARRHPDNIWVIREAGRESVSGCYAQIMLTAAGMAALANGDFDSADPAEAHCAGPDDALAGIYTWLVMAPGRSALGVTLMSHHLQDKAYRRLDLYTVPVTEDGRRSIKSISYQPVDEDRTFRLFHYRRLVNRPSAQ